MERPLCRVIETEPPTFLPTIQPTTLPTLAPTLIEPTTVEFDVVGVVAGFDAAEIQTNIDSNNVLSQFTTSFDLLSSKVSNTLRTKRRFRDLRSSKRSKRDFETTTNSVVVTDICELTKCRSTRHLLCMYFIVLC
jgi:hypothetical protein